MGRHSLADYPGATGEHTPHHPWRRGVLAALALTVLATIVGLVILWPQSSARDHVTEEFATTYGLNNAQVAGTVASAGTTSDLQQCQSTVTGTVFEPGTVSALADAAPAAASSVPGAAGAAPTSCTRALVDITEGPNAGKQTQLVGWGMPGDPDLAEGQRIQLSESPDGTYAFADYSRGRALWIWGGFVALVVIGLAAWQGLRSLIGLAYSLAVVFGFLLPGIAEGTSALPLTLVACCAIIIVAIPVVHGLNWKSASALCGSLLALGLASLIAWAMIGSTHLQGYSNEEHLKLVLYLPSVSIVGVMLSGFIIGALGGLNDVAIAQASTVTELAAARPDARPGALFFSAMKVGRDHIASMVYTIVLSYTGAVLPLLVLITAAQRPLGQMLTSDLVATELLRSSAGALALTLAVPISTYIAAWVVPERPANRVIATTTPA